MGLFNIPRAREVSDPTPSFVKGTGLPLAVLLSHPCWLPEEPGVISCCCSFLALSKKEILLLFLVTTDSTEH